RSPKSVGLQLFDQGLRIARQTHFGAARGKTFVEVFFRHDGNDEGAVVGQTKKLRNPARVRWTPSHTARRSALHSGHALHAHRTSSLRAADTLGWPSASPAEALARSPLRRDKAALYAAHALHTAHPHRWSPLDLLDRKLVIDCSLRLLRPGFHLEGLGNFLACERLGSLNDNDRFFG